MGLRQHAERSAAWTCRSFRGRGGPITKLHLACEAGQRPLSLIVTPGQAGDSPQFEPVPAAAMATANSCPGGWGTTAVSVTVVSYSFRLAGASSAESMAPGRRITAAGPA